ncbi:hypothetical protein PSY31_23475, partial [Shigella flexneri]|nr:hypothetical protein [Shigella flexneri]
NVHGKIPASEILHSIRNTSPKLYEIKQNCLHNKAQMIQVIKRPRTASTLHGRKSPSRYAIMIPIVTES